MEVPKYQDPKQEAFHKRLHSIHIKNLEQLVKSYRDEIERLMGYELVVLEELEGRKKDAGSK